MQQNYTTNRLQLDILALQNAEFIMELLNTPGWIQFIGDRNITSKEKATEYIEKIMANPNVTYWVVSIKDSKTAIGLVTLIKRDYLEHHDIGFAFLPQYNGKGYALEASAEILSALTTDPAHTHIVAITLKENANSINLLKKMGLRFDKEVIDNGETLLLYSASTDKLIIDRLTQNFFGIFTNRNKQPDWGLIRALCLPEALIIKKAGDTETIYNLDTFMEPRKKILSDGTLNEFEEKEIREETTVVGNIAQRFSNYQKSGYLNGIHFKEYGNKLFQFVKTTAGWKISSVIWEDENK
jgi:RimJ/RimL family protein N-acetyltransferase